MRTLHFLGLFCLLAAPAGAQNVLFDFDNVPVHSPLPIDLTVGGISAHFYSSGLGGFSIQAANTMGFTPAGFGGSCIFPSGNDAADLIVAFSTALTGFSILYSPQELGCDFSATMRVTAYMDGTLVGTSTTNATDLCPCTWPSQILSFTSPESFNRVVVHYDARPACQDIGTIFLADNMIVTPAPPPVVLTGATKLPNGAFQFSFTNTPNATFTVLSATNPVLPLSNWTVLSGLTEAPAGTFVVTDPQATNFPRRFYRVSAP